MSSEVVMGATVESQARSVSPETVRKATKKNKKNRKAAKRGSSKSPSGGTSPEKKPAAKNKGTRNTVTGKKLTAKEKAATRKKPAARAGTNSSQKKRAAKRVAQTASPTMPDNLPDAITAAVPAAAGPAPDDPNSIPWMVEQAEKARIAVQAALVEQARMERAGVMPSSAEDTAVPVLEPQLWQELTADTSSLTTPSDPQVEQSGASETQTAGQVQLVAAAASKHRLTRAILAAGLVVVAGFLIWHYWTPPADGVPTVQSHAPSRPDTVAQTSVRETAQPVANADPVKSPPPPAAVPEAVTTDAASAPVSAVEDERSDQPMATEEPSGTPRAQPETVGMQDRTAEPDAAQGSDFRPPAPQSRSPASGYGYYPPPPAFQQRYYRPPDPRTPAR